MSQVGPMGQEIESGGRGQKQRHHPLWRRKSPVVLVGVHLHAMQVAH